MKNDQPPVKTEASGGQHINIIVIILVEEFKEMLHFIIINWFNHSGVQIWNRFRGRFKWIVLRMNLNITIINGTMIKSTHDNRKHRTRFERRCMVFEVNCYKLAIPLSWFISWFITMKGVELFNIYSKTWWEEVRSTDDAGIRIVSNSST